MRNSASAGYANGGDCVTDFADTTSAFADTPQAHAYSPRMRDIETIDSELRLVAAHRRAARERGRPLPSRDVADALLDERRERSEGL
jgi:hypothetical protein